MILVWVRKVGEGFWTVVLYARVLPVEEKDTGTMRTRVRVTRLREQYMIYYEDGHLGRPFIITNEVIAIYQIVIEFGTKLSGSQIRKKVCQEQKCDGLSMEVGI
jgi:hypothetical protein